MKLWLVLALVGCGADDSMLGPDAGTEGDGSGGDGGDGSIDPSDQLAGCVAGRATADRADDNALDQIRVLYVVPADGLDREYDTNGKICNSIRSIARWFHTSAGDSYLRFDTQGGLLDIGFVRLTKTDAQMRGTDPNNTDVNTGTAFVRERIERELESKGLIAANKLYAVYYDGSSVYACGGGAWPPVIQDRVGAMYLRGMPTGLTTPCAEVLPWGQASLVPNYIDYGILHEVTHSLGFAPDAAVHEHAMGHVYDGTADSARDLMYSPRIGGTDPPWNVGAGLILDINHDDYYGTTPALDFAKSSLLTPLPAGPQRPIGW